MASSNKISVYRPGQGGVAAMNDSNVDDTLQGMVAFMKSEDNDKSEIDPDESNQEQRAANMNISGPSETKVTSNSKNDQVALTSYMQGSIAEMNNSVRHKKIPSSRLEGTIPVNGKSKACADCTIF